MALRLYDHDEQQSSAAASSASCGPSRWSWSSQNVILLVATACTVALVTTLLCVFLVSSSNARGDDGGLSGSSEGIPFALDVLSSNLTSGGTLAEMLSVKLTPFVTSGLSKPWSFCFIPSSGGQMLVTEFAGALKLVSNTGSVLGNVSGMPTVAVYRQGGLMDVAVDPQFAANRRVFLTFSEGPQTPEDAGKVGTAVMSAVLANDNLSLSNVQVIFRQQPKLDSGAHFGSRVVPFRRDGPSSGPTVLYVTLGERGFANLAQDNSTHIGKVVRIMADDGAPAPGNPSFSNPAALPHLFSTGHRNPQAAALHPTTGLLWLAEHGPQGGDEVNLVLPGRNYGWPIVSYGCDYGTPLSQSPGCRYGGALGVHHNPPFTPPIAYWFPQSIAPGGMTFFRASGLAPPGFAAWEGNLFVGGLAGRSLWRLVLANDKSPNGSITPTVRWHQRLFSTEHEIRDLRQSPFDGLLYLVAREDNRIYRVDLA